MASNLLEVWMTLKEMVRGVARCISAFSAHHVFDANEIELNALDSKGGSCGSVGSWFSISGAVNGRKQRT
jgi:hypothetical protein